MSEKPFEEEEMFEHPDSLKLSQIHSFYTNSSQFDYNKILDTL